MCSIKILEFLTGGNVQTAKVCALLKETEQADNNANDKTITAKL